MSTCSGSGGGSRTPALVALWLAVLVVVVAGGGLRAQDPPPPGNVPATITAEPSDEPVTLTYFNRPIAVLRARVLGREPAERADGARRALDELTARGVTGPVVLRSFDGATLISVGPRGVFALTPVDVAELSGETVSGVANEAAGRLRQALGEAAEARRPGVLLHAAGMATLALVAGLGLFWAITRAHRMASARLAALAEHLVAKSGIADLEELRLSRLIGIQRGLVTALALSLHLVVVYGTVTFVLRRFPYTRPWGESMRGFLVATVEQVGLAIVYSLPGLFTALIIAGIARFLIGMSRIWFDAVERGRFKPRWIVPETAQPTRRLFTGLVWVFAVVVAFPYVPGSQTEAFRGATVLLGLMVTIGSSGLVNQIMSGFMVTYSRALRLGDFVRIGDVEGTVIHLGVLSTKVRTLFREEVTIPNAVVVSQTTTDYSRFGETEGVFTLTSVTIGYDTPWRQVQALLLLAAERTPGLRREPEPCVLQSSLEDFYVKYTLMVSLVHQESRLTTLHALHANIQDLFNEHGVQIMSPNYVFDPAAPKIVARKDWFAQPSLPDQRSGPQDSRR